MPEAQKFIHVRSPKFPILPGERDELVNDGMYGKALAEYLRARLEARGYNAPFICCEDWGWWVELKAAPFAFGVCIYCGTAGEDPLDFFCTSGPLPAKAWSWRRFRFIDTRPYTQKLHADMIAIFRADAEVTILSTSLDSPF